MTLKESFNNLPATEKHAFSIIAERDYERSKSLWNEVQELLLLTKGKISYSQMAAQLGGIVSAQSIMKLLKKQKGFRTRRDRILPHLDNAAKLRRVVWAQSFYVFWKSVAAVPDQKVKFVLVHMDEKWFYAIRTRTNCKVLTSIGLEPTDYYAQHKSHIGKELYVVATAYVLNEGSNDITKGGKAIPLACVRVGKMVKAKKNSYKRVYRDDGTFHYPKIEGNILRRAGTEYFKGMELTGSSEGTPSKPKISLLKIYVEQIIPAIENKVVARFDNNGTREICIVKQEDGAGLHQDKKYVKEMKKEFDKRNWLIFNQPSQSPITNVHDACIFPMMSKMVSKEQALLFGSKMMHGEQLHQTVMSVWEDDNHKVAMSRAFAGHTQIVISILVHKGDNKYLTEKGGLSFGIRRTFVKDPEGEGVVVIPFAPQTEGETIQGQITSGMTVNGLKYPVPDIRTFKNWRLTEEMKGVLMEHMEPELMSDELHEIWYKISSGNIE